MSLELDPEGNWLQWGATAILAVFSGFITLLVSFGRDAHKIYREKVDALEKKQAEFSEKFITRDDFKEELESVREAFKEELARVHTEFKAEMALRYEAIDDRHLQMHNHNATLLAGVETRLGELKVAVDTRMGELRQDIKDVHERIDSGKKK